MSALLRKTPLLLLALSNLALVGIALYPLTEAALARRAAGRAS